MAITPKQKKRHKKQANDKRPLINKKGPVAKKSHVKKTNQDGGSYTAKDSGAAAKQLKALGKKTGAVKKGGKLKAKVKAFFNKPNKLKPLGDAPRPGGKQYSKKPKAQKTGPVKKTKARIAQDYARNAMVDGNTTEGRYEAGMAIKEAASKKGAIYKKGSVLSKHFKGN